LELLGRGDTTTIGAAANQMGDYLSTIFVGSGLTSLFKFVPFS